MKRDLVAAMALCVCLAATAWGEVVGRSGIGKEAGYAAATPMEQLKKLAAAAKAPPPAPADLGLLRAEAARKFLHAESKGKAADELKAYEKLTAAVKDGTLAGLTFEEQFDSPLIDYSYYAALSADDAWQKGDAKGRSDLLTAWANKQISSRSSTYYLAEWVILEHVVGKTAALPVKDRGLARLKALAELSAGDSSKGGAVDQAMEGWIWGLALAEHLAYKDDWAGMKPAERLKYLEGLYSEVKMNLWAGGSVEYATARDVLRGDERYAAAADVAAKKKVMEAIAAEYKVRNFAKQTVLQYIDGKEERYGKGEKVDDLAAAVGPTTDAGAALKKLLGLKKDHAVEREDMQAMALLLAMRYVTGGDGSKPSPAAAEMAKWKPWLENDYTHPLMAVDRNTQGPVDLMALAGVIVSDPGYAKGTWLARCQILDKTQTGYPTFGTPLWRPRQAFLRLAVVSETTSAPVAARGEAELKVLQKLRPAGSNDQLQDQTMHELAAQAVADHFSEHPGTEKARFTQITTWLNQKVLTFEEASDVVAQAAVEMLAADPAFMKLDAAGKKAKLAEMEKAKQLDFFSGDAVKRYFKVGT